MDRCRVEILTADGMTRHVADWSDLAARALEPSVFNEPAFALTAARLIPGRPKPGFLLVWDRDDARPMRLIGLCCLGGMWPGPPSVWLHAHATSAFPLLDRAAAPRALAAVLTWVAEQTVLQSLLIQGLPEDGPTAVLLTDPATCRCRTIERRSRAILRHDGPAPPLLARGDKELRRQARRLADRGEVTVGSARTPDAVEGAIERFLVLEAKGWKGRRGTALSQTRVLTDFTRTMTQALAKSAQCRVDTLAVDGAAVAAGIVLRSGPRFFYWKTAYDEGLRRLSPGVHLALAITAAQLTEAKAEVTDSCAVPDHAMIDRLWPDRMVVMDLVCGAVEGKSWRFELAIRLIDLRRSARRSVKHAHLALRGLLRRRRAPVP